MKTSAEKALERTNAERRELGLPPLERVTTERKQLLEEAVSSNEARQGEDVDAWANRLAGEVAHLND